MLTLKIFRAQQPPFAQSRRRGKIMRDDFARQIVSEVKGG